MKCYVLFFLIFISCTRDALNSCFIGNGKLKTETRKLSPFSIIQINGRMRITVLSDSLNYIELQAGENVIPYIKTEVENTTLHLDYLARCAVIKGYKEIPELKIHVIALNQIQHYGSEPLQIVYSKPNDTLRVYSEGSGDIEFNGLVYQLQLSIHGFLSARLFGSCKRCNFWMSGSAYIYASTFNVSDFLFVDSYAVAHAYCLATPTQFFSCNLHDLGNIYLYSKPNTIQNYSNSNNSGKLIYLP
jgi:hypothetical protein